jgi:hypothetical protein
MKKTYEKPMLTRRDLLSKVTADVPSGLQPLP